MSDNALCIIQARLTSKRLPRKVLLPLGDKTVLEHVYERCASVVKSVVAIPDTETNDELEMFLNQRNIPCFRGPEEDVLKRYRLCALANGDPLAIVRITSDCPLIQPELIKVALNVYGYSPYTEYKDILSGFNVQVYSRTMLGFMDETYTDANSREHLIPLNHMKTAIPKLSLDTAEDYEWIKQAMGLERK